MFLAPSVMFSLMLTIHSGSKMGKMMTDEPCKPNDQSRCSIRQASRVPTYEVPTLLRGLEMTSETNAGKPPHGVMANRSRTTVNRMRVTNPGISAVNCADIAGGTAPGNLMVTFF